MLEHSKDLFMKTKLIDKIQFLGFLIKLDILDSHTLVKYSEFVYYKRKLLKFESISHYRCSV